MRLVLATVGTLGDVRPYISVGRELQKRGHSVLIAAPKDFSSLVTNAGLQFVAIPPDLGLLNNSSELRRKALSPLYGTYYVINKLLLPSVEDCFYVLLRAAQGADLIVGHFLAYAVQLVAEALGIPWLQVYLHPMALMSAYDPMVFTVNPLAERLRTISPLITRAGLAGLQTVTASLADPLQKLRRKLGLGHGSRNPLFETHSPHGNLGWFSSVLMQPQPDWPTAFHLVGYPFSAMHEEGQCTMTEELSAFLQERSPVIYTLGSLAVLEPRKFYAVAADVAHQSNIPTLLLGPSPSSNRLCSYRETIMAAQYLPYESVFRHGRLVVHHGGMGAVSETLRASKPSIVVPFAWDQPDNAARVARSGLGTALSLRRLTTSALTFAIDETTTNRQIARNVIDAGKVVASEKAAERSAEIIEQLR